METDEKPDDLLAPRDVAGLLKVSVEALAQWRHRRQGPPWIDMGPKLVRYRRGDVGAWLAGQRVDPNTQEGAA